MASVGLKELIALARVIGSGRLQRHAGKEPSFTTRFEAALKQKLDVKHVLAVNSGTSALVAALVGAGIGPGDEVLVPAYTWVSTAVACLAVGAVPILVDIDESLTISPEDIVRKITPYTKAIIPVHMLNLVCNMDAIVGIARKFNLRIIEDACQAVGVSYKGRRVGTIGEVGAFSFSQRKNISSGEGGAVLTHDDRIFSRARIYHDVGSYVRDYEVEGNEPLFAGLNMKMAEMAGAVLHAQVSKLDPLLKRLSRRRNVMVESLSKSRRVRISPHHDASSAVGLSVIFEKPEEAEAFGKQRGVQRLIETERHVYTNWIPVLTQRTFDERMNPYRWAHREISYSADMCSRTLDVLRRTCNISLGAEYPLVFMQGHARRLLRSLA
jgi:dTDP-4-amino-4,6-dideoxygalactose transaminase